MRTIIAILIMASAAAGCATQKRCLEKWPPEITPIDTVTVTQVRDTTIYRENTITIRIPGDTVRDTVEIIPRPEPTYTTDTVKSETQLARAKAWIEIRDDRPFIHLQLEQKQTDLQVRLDSAIQQRDRYRQELTTIRQTYTEPVFEPTPWYRFTSVAFWIFGAIVAFYLVLTFWVLKKR